MVRMRVECGADRTMKVQMREETEMVEAVERRVRMEFLAGMEYHMSHQSHTASNIIINSLTNLQAHIGHSLSQDAVFYLQTALNAQRRHDLYNDTLNCRFKILRGAYEPMIEEIKSAKAVAQGLLETFQTEIQINELQASVHEQILEKAGDLGGVEPVPLVQDWRLYELTLATLLENSFKFTTQGSVKVELHTTVDQSGKASLLTTIEDTGKGIENHRLEHIFEAFKEISRARSLKQTTDSSVGLGLSSCKVFVEAMGGFIMCEQTEAQGTRIKFRVPLLSPALKKKALPPKLRLPHASHMKSIFSGIDPTHLM